MYQAERGREWMEVILRVRADIIGHARNNVYVNLSHAWFTGGEPRASAGRDGADDADVQYDQLGTAVLLRIPRQHLPPRRHPADRPVRDARINM